MLLTPFGYMQTFTTPSLQSKAYIKMNDHRLRVACEDIQQCQDPGQEPSVNNLGCGQDLGWSVGLAGPGRAWWDVGGCWGE